MVRVKSYKIRTNADGENFNALIVEGIVLVRSKSSGMFYATSKEASIPCTFSEDVCQGMIGHEIDGNIQRFECDPYTVVDKETGEEKVLHHRYEFVPEQRKQVYTTDEVMELSELEEIKV